MASQQNSKNTSSTSGASNPSDPSSQQPQPKAPSTYQTVKEGWGNRKNFQASYGLGMDPDGIEEGNAILKAMQEQSK